MGQSGSPIRSSLDGKVNWDTARGIFDLDTGNKALSPHSSGNDTVSLQTAITTLNEAGGGTLLLRAGTYTITSNITLKSSVNLKGEKESTTIINFNSNSASFNYADTAYTTGTITSITGGVSVTGSGTSWLANASAGQYLWIANRHYLIAAVTSNTTLTLAEGYIGNATLPGAAYRISTILKDVDFSEMTIKSSAADGMAIQGCKNITLENMTFLQNNVGIDWDYVSECKVDNVLVVSSTADGVEMDFVGFGDFEGFSSNANGGDGFDLTNCETLPFAFCSATSNTADGFNMSTVIKSYFAVEARANGGQGMELVGGCDNNHITKSFIISNTSDGIKLTASDDRNIIEGNIINSNGGYGVNIAAASCDKNLVHGTQFSGNTSGTIQDLGTGNIGADNVV